MELEPERPDPCDRSSWRGWGVGLANLLRPPELPFKTLYLSLFVPRCLSLPVCSEMHGHMLHADMFSKPTATTTTNILVAEKIRSHFVDGPLAA